LKNNELDDLVISFAKGIWGAIKLFLKFLWEGYEFIYKK